MSLSFTGVIVQFVKNQVIDPELSSSVEFGNVFGVYYSLQGQRYNAYMDLLVESDSLLQNLNTILSK